jgi:hypothetical protein
MPIVFADRVRSYLDLGSRPMVFPALVPIGPVIDIHHK